MSETKPVETKPKKMVGRSVAIALGIMCVVVVAGLAGAFAYYVNDQNNTISSLTSQVSQLNSNVTNLRDQVGDLNYTLNFHKMDPWFVGWMDVNQTFGSYSSWNHSVPYAGAILVVVLSPAENSTYIRVLWNNSFAGIQYDYQTYGLWQDKEQSAAFTVLPTSNVEIRVGNADLASEVQVEVFMEYMY